VPDTGVASKLRDEIRRAGPIPFADFQAAALDAFFARGGGAGRAGRDFVTSPEVGPLFGTALARGLDETWVRLDRPDPFVLVDAGGGRGRLLASVLAAHPACAPALRAVLVERSARLRADAREALALEPPDAALGPFAPTTHDEPPAPVTGVGPVVTALDDVPDVPLRGVVVANELLDNLPVRIVERAPDGWREVRVGLDDDRFVEVPVDASPELAHDADEVAGDGSAPPGARLPVPVGAAEWLERIATTLRRGELWVIDYADETDGLLARGPGGPSGWLRTYRGHGRGSDPLDDPGGQDVTTDVPLTWLRRAARRAGYEVTLETTQAEWLRGLGLDELVAEGSRQWEARAHVGDLAAIAGRSRTVEAAALTDRSGLGAHRVVVLARS
jgi:NADH dehydrogenase [ubiquinone] 1 alpha subcomplex assembly factor 7